MGTQTKIDVITASGTWVCPAGITGVLATLVGGGGGAPGGNQGGVLPSVGNGGAGTGELLLGVPMKVVPGNSYTVTIGAGGIGSARDVFPPPAGNTSFNGFNALGSPGYPGQHAFLGDGCSGTGGGWAGGEGDSGGGYPGAGYTLSPSLASGPLANRECAWGFGGVSGAMGSRTEAHDKVTPANFDHTEAESGFPGTVGFMTIAPVMGGSNHPYHGLIDPFANVIYGGGGAGGGTIFGGNQGCDYNLNHANADPAHYGSGAPGGGSQFAVVQPLANGGTGAPGVVMIMYIG